MVLTLTVACETNRDFSCDGEDLYLLSQGRTIKSANKNAYKYLCKIFDVFKYESENVDLTDFLKGKFARWQDGKDTWLDEDSWCNQFDLTFPRNNRAEVVEISKDMYEAIMEDLEDANEEVQHENI